MNLAPIHIHPLLEIYALVRKGDCHYIKEVSFWPMKDLVHEGLIEPDPVATPPDYGHEPHGWIVTPKGEVFIEALLATPMPVQTWRIPE